MGVKHLYLLLAVETFLYYLTTLYKILKRTLFSNPLTKILGNLEVDNNPPVYIVQSFPEVKHIPVYENHNNFLDWLRSFNIFCQVNSWDDSVKARILPGYLCPEAAIEWEQLGSAVQADWQATTAALADILGPSKSSYDYSDELHKLFQAAGEPVSKYSTRVRTTFSRAYPGLPREASDMLLKECFIKGLQLEVKLEVLKSNPADFKAALEVARSCERALRITLQPKNEGVPDLDSNVAVQVSRLTREIGEIKSTVMQQQQTDRSGQIASRTSRIRRNQEDILCFKCGGRNHFARACQTVTSSLNCWNCGQDSHRAARCTAGFRGVPDPFLMYSQVERRRPSPENPQQSQHEFRGNAASMSQQRQLDNGNHQVKRLNEYCQVKSGPGNGSAERPQCPDAHEDRRSECGQQITKEKQSEDRCGTIREEFRVEMHALREEVRDLKQMLAKALVALNHLSQVTPTVAQPKQTFPEHENFCTKCESVKGISGTGSEFQAENVKQASGGTCDISKLGKITAKVRQEVQERRCSVHIANGLSDEPIEGADILHEPCPVAVDLSANDIHISTSDIAPLQKQTSAPICKVVRLNSIPEPVAFHPQTQSVWYCGGENVPRQTQSSVPKLPGTQHIGSRQTNSVNTATQSVDNCGTQYKSKPKVKLKPRYDASLGDGERHVNDKTIFSSKPSCFSNPKEGALGAMKVSGSDALTTLGKNLTWWNPDLAKSRTVLTQL